MQNPAFSCPFRFCTKVSNSLTVHHKKMDCSYSIFAFSVNKVEEVQKRNHWSTIFTEEFVLCTIPGCQFTWKDWGAEESKAKGGFQYHALKCICLLDPKDLMN